MKVFIGRSQSLWVVSPEKGKVRKLPLSLGTLIGAVLGSVALISLSLSLISHSGVEPTAWIEFIKRSVIAIEQGEQSEKLHSVIVRLQQEKDEVRRLNLRLASKLQNLEGALGNVAGDAFESSQKRGKDDKDKSKESLFKPAGLITPRLPSDQRRNLQRIDRLVLQLKHLPLRAPVENPVVNSLYGGRSSPNGVGSSFHHGIDFSLRDSTKVFATGNGVVQTVGFMHGYGLYIDIAHRPGVVTRYAHLAKSLVVEGQRMTTGQLIAQGGSSGTATGRHLHYEILINGRSRDPMIFLKLPKKLEFALKSNVSSLG